MAERIGLKTAARSPRPEPGAPSAHRQAGQRRVAAPLAYERLGLPVPGGANEPLF